MPPAATGNPGEAGPTGLECASVAIRDGPSRRLDNVPWSTDDCIFSFDKPTKKRRINVTVESQGAPKQHWEGFCVLLRALRSESARKDILNAI